jgi:hypothetical protein
MKYIPFVMFVLCSVSLNAAPEEKGTVSRLTADQLLNQVRSIKHPSVQYLPSDGSTRDRKCGFGIQTEVVNRWKEFSAAQQAELSLLMMVPATQADTIAGHFHIFFDTSGPNEPALLDSAKQRIAGTARAYIRNVAQIFNHVWDVEVDQMGYSAPPFESGQSYYNIYVQNIDAYGDTWTTDTQINGSDVPPRFRSYIIIDNDYQGFDTPGINGLKVTAAHEFHHAIQIGSYGFWDSDRYVHELTSTWFEDVVYTEVNDYYNYIPDFFNRFSGGLSFNSSAYGGYERCVWAHYLAKRFSPDMMREVWTGMRSQPFLVSMDNVLKEPLWGSNLQTAFAEFTKWTYFTRDHADTVQFFPEGNHYPRFLPLQTTTFYNTNSTASGSVYPLSSTMYEFDMDHDTITAIVANVDVNRAIPRSTVKQNIDVTLSSQSLASPYENLANGLKVKITVDTVGLWRWSFKQYSAGIIMRLQSNAAPNPFRLAEAQKLFLPINDDYAKYADVYIYNSAMKLAYSGQLSTNYNQNGGTRVIEVPASELKSKLSSGIYFILAKTVKSDYQWKVAVIQ